MEWQWKYPTYVPFVDFFNTTPDQPAPNYRVVNGKGETISTGSLGYPNCYGLSGLETTIARPFETIEHKLKSVVSEVEIDAGGDAVYNFDTLEEGTYMEMIASNPLKRGSQCPTHYGYMSSRFFFVNYGFCYENNSADAVFIKINLKGEEKIVLLHRNGAQDKYLALVEEILNE